MSGGSSAPGALGVLGAAGGGLVPGPFEAALNPAAPNTEALLRLLEWAETLPDAVLQGYREDTP